MSTPVKPLPSDDLKHILEHTRAAWSEAGGRAFFITGGTGFFGMWLLESFLFLNEALSLGMTATVLTRSAGAFFQKAPHLASRSDLRFLEGDVRDFTFPAGPFDYVIHAATQASVHFNETRPDEMMDTIVRGTRHLLDFASAVRVKKLLLTSSGAVYGVQPPELLQLGEDYEWMRSSPPADSAYTEGKRRAEEMCLSHALEHGYEVKIARCFAFVGPHLPLDSHFAIGNFIRDALAQQPILVRGDGTAVRSYLYASDLMVWLWMMLFRADSGRVYNVGASEETSIRRLAETVSRAAGGHSFVKVEQPSVSGRAAARYVPSTARAKRELGLESWVALPEGIQKTIEWLRKIP